MATPRLCSIPDCGKRVIARGWCPSHYWRWQQHGDPIKLLDKPAKKERVECSVEGCGNAAHSRGWCSTHYARWRVNGDPVDLDPRANVPRCSVEGCAKPRRVGGLCNSHYKRSSRHGDPFGGGTVRGEPMAWIHAHVGYDADDCLRWPYGGKGDGYGAVGRERAHRIMCELAHGPAPSLEHEAAHSCGMGHIGCVHPRHLSWKTKSENQMDRVQHGTSNRGERSAFNVLSEAQVLEIWSNPNGETAAALARRYGVAHGTIRSIRAGRSWGWLTCG